MNVKQALLVAGFLLLTAWAVLGILWSTVECEGKGGEYVRTAFGFACVEALP